MIIPGLFCRFGAGVIKCQTDVHSDARLMAGPLVCNGRSSWYALAFVGALRSYGMRGVLSDVKCGFFTGEAWSWRCKSNLHARPCVEPKFSSNTSPWGSMSIHGPLALDGYLIDNGFDNIAKDFGRNCRARNDVRIGWFCRLVPCQFTVPCFAAVYASIVECAPTIRGSATLLSDVGYRI